MDKLLSKKELTRRYRAKVDRIATDLDWKTHFGPDEICDIIHDIITDSASGEHDGWHPVLYCGINTINGRQYQAENVDDILPALKDKVNAKFMLGQLGYPLNDDGSYKDVSFKDATHTVTDFKFIGGVLWAKVDILDTPKGHDLRNLMNQDLVVFRTMSEGEVETIYDSEYAVIHDIIGIHAINVADDAF